MRCAEKRFNRRHPVDFTAYLMWEGRLIDACARNLSPQGALLSCNGLSCPAGMEIRVCCIVSRRYYELAGQVIHIGGGLIGVRFDIPQNAFYQAVALREMNGRVLMTA